MRPFALVLLALLPFSLVLMIVLLEPGWVAAFEAADVDVGLYALGAFPSDQGLFAQGGNPSDTRIANGAGAGIKGMVFPHYLGNFIGIGLESFGSGSEITFSSARDGSLASTNLWVFGSMLNLTLRYPGKAFVPYLGVGGGYSSGVLTHADIPGRSSDRDFEGSWAFGYQFFGGVQGNLTEKVFLFSEYKYFSANYHWKQLALDYRSQYLSFGIGLRF
jgi:opacity protein-like surface antigen